jgi:signal transduction histidine kinase
VAQQDRPAGERDRGGPRVAQPGQQALAALFAVATCATVAFRQRYPATAGVTAQGLMALDFLTWHNLAAGGWTIAWFCSLYALAVWSSRWRFVAGAAFVGLTDLSPVGRDADPANWDSTAVGFALGTVVVMLLLRRIVGDRDRRARLAERERDVAAREAVVEERARIARELHDAVAHSVSMMVIQAGAERRVIEEGSTREVLQTIEQIGRGALTEMRRLVGMLRTDSSSGPLAPQPTLADLPTLMTQVREAGLPVEFTVDGERRELPVGIELPTIRRWSGSACARSWRTSRRPPWRGRPATARTRSPPPGGSAPTWCSWTSACRSWTESRPPAGSCAPSPRHGC